MAEVFPPKRVQCWFGARAQLRISSSCLDCQSSDSSPEKLVLRGDQLFAGPELWTPTRQAEMLRHVQTKNNQEPVFKLSYPSLYVLQHSRKSVLLHHKDIRGFTFDCKPVGLTVEPHRTHKALELRQEVGQLRGEQSKKTWASVGRDLYIHSNNWS